MRTKNSIRNSIVSLISNTFAVLVAFISQAIFIRVLGIEYLGLNGLFTNVITMLSIFELGVGNAIVYNLYEPIAKNNIKKIKSLVRFYKKAYNVISIVILIIGLLLIPFLDLIVGETTLNVNIYYVYVLFLLSTVTSYVIAYKRNLLYANEQNYLIDLVHVCYLVVVNILQLLLLYLTKNYYIYLIIKIICQFLENYAISVITDKKYSYVLEKDVEKLDINTEKDIFTKVKALIYHKVGAVVINGTDNIIISIYLGIKEVGIYNNYYIIINAVKVIFSQVITSTTASVGNLLVTEKEEKRYDIFKKMRFINFWIAVFCSVALLLVTNPFISIWIGNEYLVINLVLYTLIFNFFQKMMRVTYGTFKESAGIYVEDKIIPLIESFLNIVFSIILLKIFGLAGVFMGTIVSGLILWVYSYPKFVYKKLFNRSYIDYAKETLGYIVLFLIISFLSIIISSVFNFDNLYLQILINVIISIIVPNFIIMIFFSKTDNFKYSIDLLKSLIATIKNRRKI